MRLQVVRHGVTARRAKVAITANIAKKEPGSASVGDDWRQYPF